MSALAPGWLGRLIERIRTERAIHRPFFLREMVMIHPASTWLIVNNEALATVRVLVQDGSRGQALGVVEFAGLSIQSHAMSPRGLADGLREIAQQLDEKYDVWLRARDIAPMPHLAQSEVI